MAELKLALGAVADIASGKELEDGIAGLRSHFDSKFGNDAVKPLRRPLGAANTFRLASGQSDVLILGRPVMGRVWSLNSLCVVGSDDGTAVANAGVAFYIGDASSPLLTQVIIHRQAVPYSDSFGYPDYWIHDQQQLFCVVTATGGDLSGQIVANAWVTEYLDGAAEMQHI